jgi:hypothetical protein
MMSAMSDRSDFVPLPTLACDRGTDLRDNHAVGKPLDDRVITSPSPWILPIVLWLMVPVYFLLADLFLVPGMCIWNQHDWGAIFVYMTMGVVLSQFAVFPTWLSWDTSPLWQRLAIVAVLAMVFCVAWLVSFPAGDAIDGRKLGSLLNREVLALLCLLPAIILAIDLPLQILRVLFGWRIVQTWQNPPAERPLAISDLLAAMAAVAVALTCARLAKGLIPGGNEAQFWFALAIGAACGAGGGIVIVPTLAWLTFRVRSVALGIAGVGIFSAVAFIVLWTVFFVVSRGRRMDWWESLGISISVLTFIGVTGGVFWFARAAGYRLEVRSRVVG